MKAVVYWLWLENIKGFGRVRKNILLKHFGGARYIYNACNEEIRGIMLSYNIFTPKDIEMFNQSRNIEKIIKYYNGLLKRGIKMTSIEDDDYPIRLKDITEPPNILYYRGEIPRVDTVQIGIVGARRCSNYGRIVARKIGQDLSREGVNVVSGLARGIDTYSHIGALEGKGGTTAVLGSGINVCYPKENYKLLEQIAKEGCVMTEVPVNGAPIAGNFPLRNRIISGMSNGIVIVEAAKKSGSLITADYALEQGKDVFVIPGRITDSVSEGTNELIKMGAKPVTSINDILEEYNVVREVKEEKKLDLNDVEKRVYTTLDIDPVSVDNIVLKTGITSKDLQIILLKLELKGIVCRLANNQIVKL